MAFSLYSLLFTGILYAGEIELSGVYQGKNLYIHNPAISPGEDFCTMHVIVNDQTVISNPTTSAFEVDLSSLNLGDPVTIKIIHHDECEPVIINPQVIKPKNQFKFLRIDLKSDELGWTTSGDQQGDYYYLEKRIADKWIMIKSLKANGIAEENSYSVGIMNSIGDNKYRIKYIQSDGSIIYSPLVTYYSKDDPVTFYPTQAEDKIYLSRIASYEVLDVHGNLMANGSEKVIDVNGLHSGLYYLIIDDKTEKFYKK